MANTNLQADDDRSYKTASHKVLKIQTSGAINFCDFVNDTGQMSIGGSQPYFMPTAYASAQYKQIFATDGGGATSWEQPLTRRGQIL